MNTTAKKKESVQLAFDFMEDKQLPLRTDFDGEEKHCRKYFEKTMGKKKVKIVKTKVKLKK